MPIHDWTRVPAGIFHHFHHAWIEEITRAFNRGLLPAGFYALAEQLAGSLGPDVLALHNLQGPTNGAFRTDAPPGGVKLAERQPKVRHTARTETDTYAAKAKAVVVRHASDHRIIAMVEIVSSGNKSSQTRFHSFIEKAEEAMAAGIHLLIVDLFPPTPSRDSSRHPSGHLAGPRGHFRLRRRQAAHLRVLHWRPDTQGVHRAGRRGGRVAGDAVVLDGQNVCAGAAGRLV